MFYYVIDIAKYTFIDESGKALLDSISFANSKEGAFGNFLPSSDKLSVLCNPYIQPCKGSQLAGGVKAVDVSNFSQNNDPKDVQDARNLAIP